MDFTKVKKDYEAKQAWGLHTFIDAKGCNDFVKDRNKLERFTITLCDIIDMKRFGECGVHYFGDDPKVKGYSLVQLIETSLISGHFAEMSGDAYLDIFSCKVYDPYAVRDFVKMYFKPTQMTLDIRYRG